MGSFQISSVNTACKANATFAGNNGVNDEIQITTSTATTVSYALPVNPGSCTGTFKFPDIRKFDERVYMSDAPGAASTPVASPVPGNYTVTQNVSLTSTGSVICYTTNNSNPATNGTTGCAAGSTLYTAPISIAVNTTLKAVGGGTGPR
jgi:hypothetical protein